MKRHAQITVLLLSLLALATGAFAQECPGFPQRGIEIIDALYANHKGLAHGDDDARRMLTRMIAEQMRFELGSWSTKSAGSGRPQSKDSIALPVGTAGAFCNWDWQHGSTRVRTINAGTRGEFINDQQPLPTSAVNHLGGIVAPPEPPTAPPVPPSPTPISDSVMAAIVASIQGLQKDVREIRTAQELIKADDDKRDERLVGLMDDAVNRDLALAAQLKKHDEEPTYVGKIFNHPLVKYGAMVAGSVLAGKYGFGK